MVRCTIGLALAVAIAGCGEGRGTHPDASSLFTCRTNADCDDHLACTIDNCGVGGVCAHNAIDSMCPAGQHCVVGAGCTAMMTCTDASMCDDSIACTLDTCNVGNVCGHMAVSSMCPAATPTCDPVMGCIARTGACTASSQCDDSIACTLDSCGVDMTCHHMTVDSMCTSGQRCDASMGCVAHHGCATPADCTPAGMTWWNFCDGDPMCTVEFGCTFPTARVCHDTDPCTVDSCDRTMGTNGACVFACDRSRPACMCPTAGPTCAGHFQLTPAPVGMCGPGPAAAWDLSTVQIDNASGLITVTPIMVSTARHLDTGASTMTCPTFTARAHINGACVEDYVLTVTFSDDDHLSGTFTTDFTGGPLICAGCSHHSYTFTGVRIP